MSQIWTDESRFQIWFEIEAHACDAQAELGVIPSEDAKTIWEKGKFEVSRIHEIEAETKHDVIAFLTNLAEHIGPAARWVHQGMTSSDVLDTTLSVQLVRASDLIITGISRVMDALKTQALTHRYTPSMGRSHGIHAEPVTFGLKLAGHYAAFADHLNGCAMLGQRSRLVKFQARSGLSPILTHSWNAMLPKKWV
jgi:adenylosuccinate lyase